MVKRGKPPLNMGEIKVKSQFYSKIYGHESIHVNQYTKKGTIDEPYNYRRVSRLVEDLGSIRRSGISVKRRFIISGLMGEVVTDWRRMPIK